MFSDPSTQGIERETLLGIFPRHPIAFLKNLDALSDVIYREDRLAVLTAKPEQGILEPVSL
tara:strand:- start:252 stop:434 length:183 start_codon:yes stop_codon:yes gene_type:complete